MDLQGKVAIVTGGASGIGAATVEALCTEGAQVVITDVNDELGRALAKRLTGDGKSVRSSGSMSRTRRNGSARSRTRSASSAASTSW